MRGPNKDKSPPSGESTNQRPTLISKIFRSHSPREPGDASPTSSRPYISSPLSAQGSVDSRASPGPSVESPFSVPSTSSAFNPGPLPQFPFGSHQARRSEPGPTRRRFLSKKSHTAPNPETSAFPPEPAYPPYIPTPATGLPRFLESPDTTGTPIFVDPPAGYQGAEYQASFYQASLYQAAEEQVGDQTGIPDGGRPEDMTMARVASMTSSQLQLPVATGTKLKQIEEARHTQALVEERARRAGAEPPPYEFLELIGKGSYGRVYKSKSRKTNQVVAVKILDVDKPDYDGDNALDETLKEISVLRQLSDSNAKHYVNIIEEALPVHNELWIVSEYCPGGSVFTLMKPNTSAGRGLEERYVVAIARELACAIKFVHAAGVLHRDLKCGNILISEEGRLQLCDFGVSNVLEPQIAKRSTIVGTPHFMAPELRREWIKDVDRNNPLTPQPILYGSEVDIWAYGCTIIEMVTGSPPYSRVPILEMAEEPPPRLEVDRYPEGLCELVAYILEGEPENRPTAEQIVAHPSLATTSDASSTSILKELIERYMIWEQAGGARASLFMAFGAKAPQLEPADEDDERGDWNFSTTDEFDRRYSRYSLSDAYSGGYQLPKPDPDDRYGQILHLHKEAEADRGKKRLDRLFDINLPQYRNSITAERPPSDLILRDYEPGAPNRETVIDLDFAAPSAMNVPSIDLGEIPTLKANRRMFHELEEEEEDEFEYFEHDQTERRATQDWKFPMAQEDITARRGTKDWKFPMIQEEQVNRRTVDWKFPAAVPDEDPEPPRNDSGPRRRLTKDLTLPILTAPLEDNRRTRDFVFPPREPDAQFSSTSDKGPTLQPSRTVGDGFRQQLRYVATEPTSVAFEGYDLSSAPESPLRTSIIDLDMANVTDAQRPSTADSTTGSYTAGPDFPFDLEDQVLISQTSSRASYHRPSKSEPTHKVLRTSHADDGDHQDSDSEDGQQPYHMSLHARGASVSQQGSVAQQGIKPPPCNIRQRPQHAYNQSSIRDTWNHGSTCGSEYSTSSPPPTYNTDHSADDDESLDELWDQIEAMVTGDLSEWPPSRPRRSPSRDNDLTNLPSDLGDFPLASETILDSMVQPDMSSAPPRAGLRAPPGPGGRLTLDFPVPRGPDLENLASDADPDIMAEEIRRSTKEMYNALHMTHHAFSAVQRGRGGGSEDTEYRSSSGDGGDEETDDDGESSGTIRLGSTALRSVR